MVKKSNPQPAGGSGNALGTRVPPVTPNPYGNRAERRAAGERGTKQQ